MTNRKRHKENVYSHENANNRRMYDSKFTKLKYYENKHDFCTGQSEISELYYFGAQN